MVVLSLYLLKDRLALSIFSPDLAASTGVNVDRVDLYFLLIFSLTILVGLRFMGTLLASALMILPAATARHLTDKLSNFLLVSSAASIISVVAGFLLNTFVFKLPTVGPTIVIFSALSVRPKFHQSSMGRRPLTPARSFEHSAPVRSPPP